MADILTLNDFRRNDAARAKGPTSKQYEHHAQISWQSPFVTSPDPLPNDWGRFWKAGDLWWRRGPVNIPIPEGSGHHSLMRGRSPFVVTDPLPRDWGAFWRADDFWWQQQAMATRPSPENWRWI